jgi:hypothetical protein
MQDGVSRAKGPLPTAMPVIRVETNKRMRIFLGVTEISGFYTGLYRGLQQQGCSAVYACNPWSTHSSVTREAVVREQAWPVRLFLFMGACDARVPKNRKLRKVVVRAVNLLTRLPLLIYALLTCRVFIFGFGKPFFHHAELILLRLLGKKIIHVFHGSDNRPPYLDGTLVLNGQPDVLGRLFRRTQKIRRNVKWIERWGHYCISLAQTAHHHARPVLDLLGSTGLSVNAPAADITPAKGPRRLLVLHAPSNPVAKGTERIRGIIRKLQAKGHDFLYEEIIGRPQEDVLRKLAECSFVVDQCYADTPMAGFATEAAHFGKPAVVGGYAVDHARFVSAQNGLPVETYCRPEEMEAMMERLLTDEAFRLEAGRRAAWFVSEHWSVRGVAERFMRIVKGDIPGEWWFDPATLIYSEGCCLDEKDAAEAIRGYVEAWGPSALGLDHNPSLRGAMLAFAGAGCVTSTARPVPILPA